MSENTWLSLKKGDDFYQYIDLEKIIERNCFHMALVLHNFASELELLKITEAGEQEQMSLMNHSSLTPG